MFIGFLLVFNLAYSDFLGYMSAILRQRPMNQFIIFTYNFNSELLMPCYWIKNRSILINLERSNLQKNMQEVHSKTPYRIKYLQCKKKGHEGQKLNFVDLQKGYLVCSVCRHHQHDANTIKPLKFYLQQLKQQYQQQSTKQQLQLQNLQRVKFAFFAKLREAVQKIADQFRALEMTVIEQFDSLQNQIRQNHSKRKLFDELYHTLTSEKSDGSPQQIMKLYLPKKKVNQVSNIDQIGNISNGIVKDIDSLKRILITESVGQFSASKSVLPAVITSQLYIFPPNIKKNINCFSQTDFGKDSIILLNKSLPEMKGTIRFKITEMSGAVNLTLGIIKKAHFNQLNYEWVQNQNNSIMWVSSNGKSHGQNFSYLGNFCIKNANIDARFKKGHMKFMMKKNITDFLLLDNAKDFYIFLAMKGNLKVQILYPI